MFNKPAGRFSQAVAVGLPVVASYLFASVAHAAVDEDVMTAIETAGTDAVTVATAILVVLASLLAFKLIRRAMR